MAITDVRGVRVGHWSDPDAQTGCTVVLFENEGAVAGVDVRGGAPGTRDTDLLRPGATVERVHALLLTGGSAFGLAAADGVMRWLGERGIGFEMGPARVPIVPAAVIFDLATGRASWPDADAGYAACSDAEAAAPCVAGRIGAGTGATVGKIADQPPRPGGLGTAAVRLPGGAVVGALAVVNAAGDVVGSDAESPSWRRVLEVGPPERVTAGSNTTLAVVATDARLDKAACCRVAAVAHDGLAMAIRPVHTPFDGDTVFCVSTGSVESDLLSISVGAVEAIRLAIQAAVPGA